jgi:large subunit ribosomal protein L13
MNPESALMKLAGCAQLLSKYKDVSSTNPGAHETHDPVELHTPWHEYGDCLGERQTCSSSMTRVCQWEGRTANGKTATTTRKKSMSVGPSFSNHPRTKIINASGQVVGRLAVQVATWIMGKHKPTYSPNLDHGDNVFLVNSNKLRFSGTKYTDKKYIWHTGWPGGIKTRTPKEFAERHGKPDEIMTRAVYGMLPKNKLRSQRMLRFIMFPGNHYELAEKYPHIAAEALAAAKHEKVVEVDKSKDSVKNDMPEFTQLHDLNKELAGTGFSVGRKNV